MEQDERNKQLKNLMNSQNEDAFDREAKEGFDMLGGEREASDAMRRLDQRAASLFERKRRFTVWHFAAAASLLIMVSVTAYYVMSPPVNEIAVVRTISEPPSLPAPAELPPPPPVKPAPPQREAVIRRPVHRQDISPPPEPVAPREPEAGAVAFSADAGTQKAPETVAAAAKAEDLAANVAAGDERPAEPAMSRAEKKSKAMSMREAAPAMQVAAAPAESECAFAGGTDSLMNVVRRRLGKHAADFEAILLINPKGTSIQVNVLKGELTEDGKKSLTGISGFICNEASSKYYKLVFRK